MSFGIIYKATNIVNGKEYIGQTVKNNPMYGLSGELAPASKTYIVTYPDGTKEKIHGLNKFCLENGLHSGCMVRCAKGKQKKHKGYSCEYFYGENR